MKQGGQVNKKNVAITGLTAAGKTTHARIAQMIFGLEYISGSTILREKAGFESEPPKDFWLSHDGLDLTQRLIEFNVDDALCHAENTHDGAIFDCRSLPWITRNPILSIWIESSLESRVWKAMISQGSSQYSIDDIREKIVLKDQQDRDYLLRTFGFDLFCDHEPMDLVVDLSKFITSPSIEASWRSIQMAQDIISSAVGLYITGENFYRRRFATVREDLEASVFRHFSTKFIQLLND